jgi:hypothetical protein
MKRILGFSLSLFVIFMIMCTFQTGFTSCTKTSVTDTITITKIDTTVMVKTDTISSDTALTLQILTANSWKIQYLRAVTDDTITFYTRGGTYNQDFDAEYVTFNANLTGVLVDAVGASHQMTWNWSDSSNTQITFIIQNPLPLVPQTTVWNNIRYKNDSLLLDQYWTYAYINSQAEVVWIPK